MTNAIGHLDDDLISGAVVSQKKQKRVWIKWGTIAACFAMLVLVGAAVLPALFGGDTASGKYKYEILGSEIDIEWPWEYKTNSEKYPIIEFEETCFHVKSLNPVSTEKLGAVLGTCEARGVDFDSNKQYTETFEVRRIPHVSEDKMVAAGNENGFYIYAVDELHKPATFGEVLDLYGLSHNLELRYVTKNEGYDSKGYFTVNEDAFIWQILSGCRDARLYDETDSFDRSNRNYLTFSVTSDALGVYKRVIYLSEDGYFATNLFNASYIYYIGREAAEKVIGYVQENAAEATFEPYEPTINGILTEIGEGYVKIDDTALCKRPEDGLVYKISMEDFRMKRCLACFGFEIGDAVGVKYVGTISADGEVSGAYSIYKGELVDGDLLIAE